MAPLMKEEEYFEAPAACFPSPEHVPSRLRSYQSNSMVARRHRPCSRQAHRCPCHVPHSLGLTSCTQSITSGAAVCRVAVGVL